MEEIKQKSARKPTDEDRRTVESKRKKEYRISRDVHPYAIASLSRVREAIGRCPEGVAPAVGLSGPAREINGSP